MDSSKRWLGHVAEPGPVRGTAVRTFLVLGTVTAVGGAASGCTTDQPENVAVPQEQVVCAYPDGRVADPRLCDTDFNQPGGDDDTLVLINTGGGNYPPGSYAPRGRPTVPMRDSVGRSRIGASPSGAVSRPSSGSIGRGVAGSGAGSSSSGSSGG